MGRQPLKPRLILFLAGHTAPHGPKVISHCRMVEVIRQFLLSSNGAAGNGAKKAGGAAITAPGTRTYERSVAPEPARFAQIIGAIDERITSRPLKSRLASGRETAIAKLNLQHLRVRWRVSHLLRRIHQGLERLGLLLRRTLRQLPRRCNSVTLIGHRKCLLALHQVFLQAHSCTPLAENGVQVIVPLVISRDDRFSGIPGIGMNNMPHREWILSDGLRMRAGTLLASRYQKILAAVDWF